MSKGEEIEAYTKILKFQKRRYGVNIIDYVVLAIGIIVIFGGTVWLSTYTGPTVSSFLYILAGVYGLLLIIAFADYSLGLGMFSENQILYSTFLFFFSIIFVIISVISANNIFIRGNAEFLQIAVFLLLISQSVIIAYFIYAKTPTREGRDEMIKKLDEIKKEVNRIPVSQLGSKSAVARAIRWLEFSQREDGIWGSENPLYETSEVLRTFTMLKDGLNHSWKQIVEGQEQIRTVEQTFFLVMEALETAAIEPNYEMLIPVLAVGEVNPEYISLTGEAFEDFLDELTNMSEWAFVQSLETFDERQATAADVPIIFPMSRLYYLSGNFDVAQKTADIFSSTFDILIKRTQTRFSIQGERQISNLLLGKMYNALVVMIRGYKQIQSGNILNEFGLEEELLTEEESETQEMDMPEFSLPDMDFDMPKEPEPSSAPSQSMDGFDVSLPDTSMEEVSVSTESSKSSVKIEVSMASIRNFLRSKQSIDGSWSGRIDTTSECLYAVSDQESPESDFIKLAVHYLLALQDKNGSWQNDIVLTAQVLRSLIKINQSIGLGGF